VNRFLRECSWFNEPALARKIGNALEVTSQPKSDFWQKTMYGYSADTGHFFHLSVASDFILEGRVSGRYAALYDQAGMMVRQDTNTWLKCGVVLIDGVGHATTVVTRHFSDWSTVPGIRADVPTWWRVVRKGRALEILYSIDGEAYTSVRVGYLPLQHNVDAGIMCASPEGQGFQCRFDHLRLGSAENEHVQP
jgi:uncharacterized protein